MSKQRRCFIVILRKSFFFEPLFLATFCHFFGPFFFGSLFGFQYFYFLLLIGFDKLLTFNVCHMVKVWGTNWLRKLFIQKLRDNNISKYKRTNWYMHYKLRYGGYTWDLYNCFHTPFSTMHVCNQDWLMCFVTTL